MQCSKFILAAGVALAAISGVANADVSPSGAVSYIAGGTAPASLTLGASGAASVVVANTDGTTGILTTGNTITFTLSQGTFSSAPTATTDGVGTTLTLASGGTGSSQITYNVTASTGAAATVTLSNIQVAGVSTALGSTATPNVVSVVVSSNAVGVTASTTSRTALLATFVAPVTPDATSTTATFAVDVTMNPNFAAGAVGTATFSTPSALLNYSNAAVAFSNASLSFTFPFAAGSLASATLSGTCLLVPVTLSGTTGATALTSGSSTVTGGTVIAGAGPTSCAATLSLADAAAATAALPAVGAASVSATFPITNVPGLTSATVSRPLSTLVYTGGTVTNLGFSFGNSADYQYFLVVNNRNAAAASILVSSGNFSGVLSAPAGVTTLFNAGQVANALIASGAPNNTLAGGTAIPLGVVAPMGTTISPVIRNVGTGVVTDIGRVAAGN